MALYSLVVQGGAIYMFNNNVFNMLKNVSPVAVEKTKWGRMDGKEVFLFCLENKRGTKLFVSNFGAIAHSLLYVNKAGVREDILLGYDRLQDYEADRFYMGGVIGRYANRIAGGTVVIDGAQYRLSTVGGEYHLHGGEKGFNKKVFDYAVLNGDPSSIRFFYTSDDMEEGFPGKLDVQVTYCLDELDNWHIEYECTSDRTTLLNLTQHAYFNLKGHDGGTILDHAAMIYSPVYLPVNRLQVPTGELAPVKGTPFDFSKPVCIGARIDDAHEQLILSNGYDHSWVLKKASSADLVHAATIKETTSGRKLDVYTTEPAIHFYSGNFLGGVNGKNNTIYHKRSGFCLETQHYPDAPNQPGFPSTILRAGERFYSKTIFSLSVE